MRTIKYHELPLSSDPLLTRCVSEWSHQDGRCIRVLEIKGGNDFIVKLTAPIGEESQSELVFRISNEGAIGLALAIFKAIDGADNTLHAEKGSR